MSDVPMVPEALKRSWGDGAYEKVLEGERMDGVTLVTAVDKKYLPYFKKAWPIWMKRKDLSEMKVIVFLSGISKEDKALDFLREERVGPQHLGL